MVKGSLLSIPVWLMPLALGVGGLFLYNYCPRPPKAPEFSIVSAEELRLDGLKAGGLSFDLALLCSEPEELKPLFSTASESFAFKGLAAKLEESFPKMREDFLARGQEPEFQREFERRLRTLVNGLLPQGLTGRALDATVSNLKLAD